MVVEAAAAAPLMPEPFSTSTVMVFHAGAFGLFLPPPLVLFGVPELLGDVELVDGLVVGVADEVPLPASGDRERPDQAEQRHGEAAHGEDPRVHAAGHLGRDPLRLEPPGEPVLEMAVIVGLLGRNLAVALPSGLDTCHYQGKRYPRYREV